MGQNKWEDRTFKFKNYASTFDFRNRDALTEVEQLSRTTSVDTAWIDNFDLNNPHNNPNSKDFKQLDKDLYSVLSELQEGPAQTHVAAERTSGSGLAVWKRLTARYSTASSLKAKKLMNEVCNFNFRQDHFMDDLDKWDTKISDYTTASSGGIIQEDLLSTHLYVSTTGALREHLH